MAEFEKPKHGEICWRELNTKDLGAAVEFYRGLFGWTIEQSAWTGLSLIIAIACAIFSSLAANERHATWWRVAFLAFGSLGALLHGCS